MLGRTVVIERPNGTLTLRTLREYIDSTPGATEIRMPLVRYRALSVALSMNYQELRDMLNRKGLPIIVDESVPSDEIFVVLGDIPLHKLIGGSTVYRMRLPKYPSVQDLLERTYSPV